MSASYAVSLLLRLEQRRLEFGGAAYPHNPKTGLVIPAANVTRETSAAPKPRPSYAKPLPSLDRGEGTGRGTVPEGGMKVA